MTKANPYAACRACRAVFLKPRKRSVYCSALCAVMGHVERNGNNCWPWHGALRQNGYGSLSYNGKSGLYPHRMMLEIKLGRPLRPGLETRHTCDNRACVNPDHLLEGTRADNMRDCVERGRHVGIPPRLTGEAHHNARLTEADVRAIRASGGTHQAVADQYGISRQAVAKIKSGERWAHLGV